MDTNKLKERGGEIVAGVQRRAAEAEAQDGPLRGLCKLTNESPDGWLGMAMREEGADQIDWRAAVGEPQTEDLREAFRIVMADQAEADSIAKEYEITIDSAGGVLEAVDQVACIMKQREAADAAREVYEALFADVARIRYDFESEANELIKEAGERADARYLLACVQREIDRLEDSGGARVLTGIFSAQLFDFWDGAAWSMDWAAAIDEAAAIAGCVAKPGGRAGATCRL